MHTAACPKCNEPVSLPAGAAPEVIVRCPLCQAEYALDEALAKLPPALVVISMPAPHYAPAESLPHAAPELALAAALSGATASDEVHAALDLTEPEPAPIELGDELTTAFDESSRTQIAPTAMAPTELDLEPTDAAADAPDALEFAAEEMPAEEALSDSDAAGELTDDGVADALALEAIESPAADGGWEMAPPAEENADLYGAAETPAGYEEIALEGAAPGEEGYSFEEAEAPSAMNVEGLPTGSARMPKPPKRSGGILQVAGVVLGGLMAIPLAQLVLWWLPGDWARDFGLAKPVANIGLGFLVPEKFVNPKAASQQVALNNGQPPPAEKPKAPAKPKPADNGGDMLDQALNTNKQNLPPQAGPAEQPPEKPAEEPSAEPKPALPGEMPEEKKGDLGALPTEPPAIPEPEIKIAPAETIADPFGIEGNKGAEKPAAVPSEPTPEKPAENPLEAPSEKPAEKPDPFTDKPLPEPGVEPTPEVKPAAKPDIFDEPKPEPTPEPMPEPKPEPEVKPAATPVVALTGDAATVVKDAPALKAEELMNSLTATAAVEKLWDALAADAPKEERGKVAREMRETLATLGQAATFLDAEAAKDPVQAESLHQQLEHLAADTTKLQVVAVGAAGWLASPSRSSNGVVLAGTVKEVKKAGELYETHVELLTPKGGTFAVLLGKQDPSAALAAGTRVVVAGSIIDDPAANVAGYTGEAKQVVWSGQVVPLAAKE